MDSSAPPLSPPQIMAAVEHLSLPELEDFTSRVLALRAARCAPHVCADETTLLKRINQTLPEDLKARMQALLAKQEAAELLEPEYTELASLIDRLEILQADRMAALVALAQCRGMALDEIMHQLGIHFPDHDREGRSDHLEKACYGACLWPL